MSKTDDLMPPEKDMTIGILIEQLLILKTVFNEGLPVCIRGGEGGYLRSIALSYLDGKPAALVLEGRDN